MFILILDRYFYDVLGTQLLRCFWYEYFVVWAISGNSGLIMSVILFRSGADPRGVSWHNVPVKYLWSVGGSYGGGFGVLGPPPRTF